VGAGTLLTLMTSSVRLDAGGDIRCVPRLPRTSCCRPPKIWGCPCCPVPPPRSEAMRLYERAMTC